MNRRANHVESVLQWAGMRSEYAWLAPHEGFSVTGANQIGASFTPHRGLVYSQAGRESVRNVEAGAVFVTGTDGITWSRVRERTEALEIYRDRQARLAGSSCLARRRSRDGLRLIVWRRA